MMRKELTLRELKVYYLCSQIPKGYVSTYKNIADFIITSPRVVGQILKKNPFDFSIVPCHRVIRSDLFIGGYLGSESENSILSKRKRLNEEKVIFNERGYLLARDKMFKSFSKTWK
jgi:O-6-methylguanine DNA methyltransferase